MVVPAFFLGNSFVVAEKKRLRSCVPCIHFVPARDTRPLPPTTPCLFMPAPTFPTHHPRGFHPQNPHQHRTALQRWLGSRHFVPRPHSVGCRVCSLRSHTRHPPSSASAPFSRSRAPVSEQRKTATVATVAFIGTKGLSTISPCFRHHDA